MDKAREQTDKKLTEMEKEVSKIYSDAYNDISKKWNDFMKSHYPKLKDAQEKLKEAEKSGDKNEIAKARDLYERTAKNITVNNRRFQSMSNETAAKLSHTNEVASSYVNNQMASIYTTNYNAFGENSIDGYSFSLTNEQAVKELATKDSAFLPAKKVDISKDMKWNEKMINSQMLQGILQGESIPKMADRLMNVIGMNRTSAIRNARTMTTAAENKGRQDSFEKAQSDGVIMKRRWVATHDERTRAWHEELDGQEVDLDEPWENEYGEIMYPGDPSADPCNVYNCRCSIRAVVKGFKWNQIEEPEPAEEEKQPFKLVRTRAEAYEVANAMFGSVSDNIKKIDEQLLCDNINQLQKLNQRFGALTENNMGYITASPSGRAMAYTSSRYMPDPNGELIENTNLGLVGKYYNNPDYLIEKEKEAIEHFWSMPVAEENLSVYSLTHEYGHILENRIEVARTDYNALKEKIDSMVSPSNSQIRKVYNDAEKSHAKDIYKEIIGIAKENNPDFSLKDNLSEYGHTNYYEFFAECFANSQCGAPNELGIAMEKWLVKEGF